MLGIAETYGEGRAKTLQSFGLKTYNKDFYDILKSGDMARLRGYLFIDAPREYIKNSVFFAENHDELPALDAFETPEKEIAAAVIAAAAGGYMLVPYRQILGMRRAKDLSIEMKSPDAGIYPFKYPSRQEADSFILQEFERILPVMSRGIFRGGEPFSAKLDKPGEHRLDGLMPMLSYLEGDGFAVTLVNNSSQTHRVHWTPDHIFGYEYPNGPA